MDMSPISSAEQQKGQQPERCGMDHLVQIRNNADYQSWARTTLQQRCPRQAEQTPVDM